MDGEKYALFVRPNIELHSLREREELTWPEKFLKDTTGWVGNVFNKPVSGITGFVGDLKELQHTYDENKKLKA